jgi:hypothetical protein
MGERMKLQKTDVHDKETSRYLQQCGCQYVWITDRSGHAAVLWQDICARHYEAGRR